MEINDLLVISHKRSTLYL